jgi:hypothetical protein
MRCNGEKRGGGVYRRGILCLLLKRGRGYCSIGEEGYS